MIDHRPPTRAGRRFAAALAVSAAAVTLAACGDDGDSGGSGDGTGSGDVPKLNVSVGSVSPALAPFFLAQTEGLFEKHGVDVNVVSYQGAEQSPSLLVSGQVDVAVINPGQLAALTPQAQTVTIMNLFNQDYSTFGVIGGKGNASVEDLQAKGDDCKIATVPPGGLGIGWTIEYMKKFDLKCELIHQKTFPAIDASVTSGSADAGVTSPTDAATLVKQGQATSLWDPATVSAEEGNDLMPEVLPIQMPSGLPETLEEKRDAVVPFLAALAESLERIPDMTAEEIAESIVKNDAWAGVPRESVVAGVQTLQKSYAIESGGQIDEASWQSTVDKLKEWGVAPDIDVADPKFQYDTIVDMSYLDEATSSE